MESWSIVLSMLAALLGIYYAFGRRSFFEEHDIIHTKKRVTVRNIVKMVFRRFLVTDMVKEMYNQHSEAKYVGSYDFVTPVIVIRDLDLVKSITVKNFDHFVDRRGFVNPDQEPLLSQNLLLLRGQRWKKVRNLLTPAFTSRKMREMFKLMSNYAEDFTDFFTSEIKDKSITYNSKDLFGRFTTDLIATCAFGVSVNSLKDPTNDFYVLSKKSSIFQYSVLLKLILMRIAPAVAKLVNVRAIDKKVEKFFTELVKTTIETRDREGIARPDMIQLMMEARNNKEGPTLNISEMTSQAFIFFFAGFDTTSTVMCFAAHHIACDLEIQRKLQEEVDEAYEKHNETLTYETINNMPYVDAFLNEILRMYPVAPSLDRLCTKEFELPPALPGKKPVLLKPGDYVWLPIYAFHMDPHHFPDPEKFYPERFIEDPANTLHSSAYFPFGVGPRMCIGNRFAMLEIKVLLFYLILKCTLKIGDKMIMPMRLSKSSVIMMAEGGFWLTLEPRGKWKTQRKQEII